MVNPATKTFNVQMNRRMTWQADSAIHSCRIHPYYIRDALEPGCPVWLITLHLGASG